MPTISCYVKKKLELGRLTVPQREMHALGNVALDSIKKRVARACDSTDAPAPPLKSEAWKHIKKAKGLRPIRDLWGTGYGYPEKSKATKRKRKYGLKWMGHLMDQIRVNRVSDNMAVIEATTRIGRKKANRHRSMLLLSPNDIRNVQAAANRILSSIISGLGKLTGKAA